MASWYVFNDNTQSMFTPLVNVTVGQTLTGVISLTGSSGSNYNYQSSFNGIAGTFLSVSNIEELVTATETLEAYDIVESGNYPIKPDRVLECHCHSAIRISGQISPGAPPATPRTTSTWS